MVEMFSNGVFHAVPVIIGDVSDEGRMFVYPKYPTPPSYSVYSATIDKIFSPDGNEVCRFPEPNHPVAQLT
jgi:hypothetical protein